MNAEYSGFWVCPKCGGHLMGRGRVGESGPGGAPECDTCRDDRGRPMMKLPDPDYDPDKEGR